MRMIINGKRYDTETATAICRLSEGKPATPKDEGDLNYEDTWLYRTAKGNWFLAGKGGPYSRWGLAFRMKLIGGGGLKPLTHEEARALLEEQGRDEAIERWFPDRIEDA